MRAIRLIWPLAGVVLAPLAVLAAAAPALAGAPVAVYMTPNSSSGQMTRRPDVHFGPSSPGASVVLTVDPQRSYQRIMGFGAAFTDSSLYLLSKLPAAERQGVLRRVLLADPGTGSAGLSVMRVPMGSPDFTASGMYSYDDNGGLPDPSLAHFSIAHDETYILPILREALAINPRLRILANPWSPPGWMKTNDSMLGITPTGGPGLIEPQYYPALAQYFVKFIEAYRAAGVPIWAVTPQNEPEQPALDYPQAYMTAAGEATFVEEYLAPALRSAGLGTRIYGYDYIWAGSESYTVPLMAAARGGLAGIAYHCYFGAPESMSLFHTLFPAAEVIEDECSTGISVLSPIQNLLRSVENWASVALMWNVALDPSGGPKIGSGCLTCTGLITIDPAGGKVSYNGGYWQFAQAGDFVARGARRIAVAAWPPQPPCASLPVCGLEDAAFRDPDGDTVLIATNSGAQPVTFAVRQGDGQSFSYTLPGQNGPNGTDNTRDAAVVTFLWGPTLSAGEASSGAPG